jgi:UDP-N-acetylglucosamine diphosphorylase/glucosamine-1-phosphate N-acetyltransferase
MAMNEDLRWGVAVLAAGKGTRMNTELPKVLHPLAGRPLVDHVLDLALGCAAPEAVVVVVGHGGDQVAELVTRRGARTALQEPQLGTGDALRVAMKAMSSDPPEAVLVLSGDVPLLRPETLSLLQDELRSGATAVLLTAELDEAGSYGRVLRSDSGAVRAVVEARDADPETLALHEVNAGVYGFRFRPVQSAIEELAPNNDQREYYLTDVAAILQRDGHRVAALRLNDPDEMQGVNTLDDLARVERLLAERG